MPGDIRSIYCFCEFQSPFNMRSFSEFLQSLLDAASWEVFLKPLENIYDSLNRRIPRTKCLKCELSRIFVAQRLTRENLIGGLYDVSGSKQYSELVKYRCRLGSQTNGVFSWKLRYMPSTVCMNFLAGASKKFQKHQRVVCFRVSQNPGSTNETR